MTTCATQKTAITRRDLLIALTYALDLTEQDGAGHALRCCLLGMRIGQQLGLPATALSDLYYALLLKDLGSTSIASSLCELMGMGEADCSYVSRTFDWSRLHRGQLRFLLHHAFAGKPLLQRVRGLLHLFRTRKERGQELTRKRGIAGERIARELHFSEDTAAAIRWLDEHWDGNGEPNGLSGADIPLLAQICNLAQTLEVFEQTKGRAEAMRVIEQRCGTWFDPKLALAVVLMHEAGRLWANVARDSLLETVLMLDPHGPEWKHEGTLEEVCVAFAGLVDTKSHYTFLHSRRVADLAKAIGAQMDLPPQDQQALYCAALLHDIGKLAVPNTVLDKNGPLSDQERTAIHLHPVHSYEVLRRIPAFEGIARIARAHHERIDGKGYPDGLSGHDIPFLARILAVADKYDALSSERPYRSNLAPEEAMRILQDDVPNGIDPEIFSSLCSMLDRNRAAIPTNGFRL